MKTVTQSLTPHDRTRALIEEVIWWHNQTGNPVTYAEVMGTVRTGRIVEARRDCIRRIYETRKHLPQFHRDANGSVPNMSLPLQIARIFGKDRTTILHHLDPDRFRARATARSIAYYHRNRQSAAGEMLETKT